MSTEQVVSIAKVLIEALNVLVWPAFALFIVVRFSGALQGFFSNLSEFTFKAPGMEASARRQTEAAALMVAAEASRTSEGQRSLEEAARSIARLLSAEKTPRAAVSVSEASILWVDDNPENNRREREALEALGIRFWLAQSTEEALQKVEGKDFDVIISDMGREPDWEAGLTLLDKLKDKVKLSKSPLPPFIIYAGSNAPKYKDVVPDRGGWGCTNRPRELFDLVLSALKSHG